jgi:hypothetical protein
MSTFNDASEYASLAVYGIPYQEPSVRKPNPDGTPLNGVLKFKGHSRMNDTCSVTLTCDLTLSGTVSRKAFAEVAIAIEKILTDDYELIVSPLPCSKTYVISLLSKLGFERRG